MNLSKWHAYYLAQNVKLEYPEGISLSKLRKEIVDMCGADERTIKKYLDILRYNNYLLDKANVTSVFIANPDLDNMKPMTPKQRYEARKRAREKAEQEQT